MAKKTTLLVMAILLVVSVSSIAKPKPIDSQSPEAVFEQVFGKKPPNFLKTVQVQLYVNRRGIGMVKIKTNLLGTTVQIDKESLVTCLDSAIVEHHLKPLRKQPSNEGWLHLEKLNEAGFNSLFDAGRLRLAIKVPTQWRKVEYVYLNRIVRSPLDMSRVVAPASLSAYVNLRSAINVNFVSESGINYGLGTHGAFNRKEWALVHDSTFTQDKVGLNQLYLNREFVSTLRQVTIGEAPYPTIGFQGTHAISGIGFSKGFLNFSGSTAGHPDHYVEIVLDSTANVEVWLNGDLLEKYDLEDGTYRFSQFPMASGPNEVEVKVLQNSQLTTHKKHTFIYSESLIVPDRRGYGVLGGFTYDPTTIKARYQQSKPAGSVFYRHIFTQNLTFGEYIQVDPNNRMAGVETLWGKTYGLIRSNVALSRHSGQSGYACDLRLESHPLWNPPKKSAYLSDWQIGAVIKSAHFSRPGESVASANPVDQIQLNAGLNFTLFKTGYLRLSGFTQTSDLGHEFGASATVGCSFKWGTAELTFQRQTPKTESPPWIIVGALNYTFSRIPLNVSSRYNAVSNQHELNWNLDHSVSNWLTAAVGSNGVRLDSKWESGGLKSRASYINQNQRASWREALSYQGNRGYVNAAYYESYNEKGQKSVGALSLQTSSAIVYADGRFATSDIVRNGFVIVYPKDKTTNYQLSIGKNKADMWGPVVVTDLRAQDLNVLQIQAKGLPIGSVLGPREIRIVPASGRGYAIPIVEGGQIFVIGTALDENKKPLVLTTGIITNSDNPSAEKILFFTNRTGQFQVIGLTPGRYELNFGSDYPPVPIDISTTKKGIVKLGDIILKKEGIYKI